MKTKKGYTLRTVGDEHIIISGDAGNVDFSRIISFNEPAVYLWKEIESREFVVEDLAQLLLSRYEVAAETALDDARLLVEEWLKAGIIEE